MTSAHAALHLEAVRAWLAQHGWEAERVWLYDEEGVEGWIWIHADTATEFTLTGDWNDQPDIPDHLTELAEKGLAETFYAHSAHTA